MLICKKLNKYAFMPTVSYPGEDLGYDLYAVEDAILLANTGKPTFVKTGISARYIDVNNMQKYGLIFKDRSSMAKKGITVSGGVIDSTYLGELIVMLTNNTKIDYTIKAGDKIVQMIPVPVYTTDGIKEVFELGESTRKDSGFGSSGR
jgi:dUTP pyrophosphatase